jgi:restriction system protein
MLPSYAMVRALLRTLPGTSKRAVRGMITAIYQETGTPDDQVRWNNPDKWITDRLSGEDARVAQLIWQGSGKTVNPRYIYSGYLFINGFDLLRVDEKGIYRLTERGMHFLDNDGSIMRSIDIAEGIPAILGWVKRFDGDRARLIEQWRQFLDKNSPFRADSSVRSTLADRLNNLMERELIVREGRALRLTDSGRAYLTRNRKPERRGHSGLPADFLGRQ